MIALGEQAHRRRRGRARDAETADDPHGRRRARARAHAGRRLDPAQGLARHAPRARARRDEGGDAAKCCSTCSTARSASKIGLLRVFRYTVDAHPRRRDHRAAAVVRHRPVVHRAAQVAADRRDDPRRRPADPQEEGRHADDGRLADPVLPRGVDAVVVRPAQPVRVARAHRHRRVRRDRVRRRLREGRQEEQEGHQRQAPPRPRVRDRRRRDGVPVLRRRDARRGAPPPPAAVHELLRARASTLPAVAVRRCSARSSSSAPRTRST